MTQNVPANFVTCHTLKSKIRCLPAHVDIFFNSPLGLGRLEDGLLCVKIIEPLLFSSENFRENRPSNRCSKKSPMIDGVQ